MQWAGLNPSGAPGILLLGPFLFQNVHLSRVPKKKAKQDFKVPKKSNSGKRYLGFWGWFYTGAGPLSGDPESSSPAVVHVQVELLLLGVALESPSYEEVCLGTKWFLSVNLMLFPPIPKSSVHSSCSSFMECLSFLNRNHLSVQHNPYGRGCLMSSGSQRRNQNWRSELLGRSQSALLGLRLFHMIPQCELNELTDVHCEENLFLRARGWAGVIFCIVLSCNFEIGFTVQPRWVSTSSPSHLGPLSAWAYRTVPLCLTSN